MAINPATSVYGSHNPDTYAAVVDVDISRAYPNDPTVDTAKAVVVYVAGSTPGGTSVVEGEGVAGTPAGGVLTVQGDAAGTPLPVTSAKPSTGTVTSVASAATSTTLLAANSARLGVTIYNTDANPLKVLLASGTASATNFSVNIASNGYYEVPYNYTGIIVGIWDADGAGVALITQFTA